MKVPSFQATAPRSDPSPAPGQGRTPVSLTLAIKQEALRLGFSAAGVAPSGSLHAREAEFRRWLANGYAGGLSYMENFLQRQAQLLQGFPGLRSIVVLAAAYAERGADTPAGASPEPEGRVARYAQGRDYHRAMRKRIRRLEAFIREQTGGSARTLHSVD